MRRPLTRAEMLEHPWWGVECPSCGAEPGEACRRGDPNTIHGTRTYADILAYTDPRKSEAEQPGQLNLF